MIVQLAGLTLGGQDGATRGVAVEPRSTTAAEATAGASAAPTLVTTAVVKSRFICPFNTRPGAQLRPRPIRTTTIALDMDVWIASDSLRHPGRNAASGRGRIYT